MAKVKKVKLAAKLSESESSSEHVATNYSKRKPASKAKAATKPKKTQPVASEGSNNDVPAHPKPKNPPQKSQPQKPGARLFSSSEDESEYEPEAIDASGESSDEEEPPVAPKKKQGMAKKADIVFPPLKFLQKLKESRVANVIHKCEWNERISKRTKLIFFYSSAAAVYCATVLEYLTAEMVELAGNAATADKKKIIQPRHLQLAISNDSELSKLLKDVIIPGGGVLPHIAPALLPKKVASKR